MKNAIAWTLTGAALAVLAPLLLLAILVPATPRRRRHGWGLDPAARDTELGGW